VPYACGPIREDKFEAFAAFMEQLVLRYGSGTPYNVRYWHLGNEMDVAPGEIGPDSFFGCWGDTADPYYGGEHYGEMLKVVYPRMKAADPDAQVMMGGLLLECDPYTSVVGVDCINQNRWQSGYFLDGVMRAGGGDYFDIFDLHSYAVTDTVPAQMRGYYAWSDSGGGTDLPERVAFVRQVMGSYGHGDKPIFAGEVALKCEEPAPECYEVAAAFVPRVYAEAYQLNLLGVNYYSLISEFKYKGLLLPDFTPRPAYWAYKFMSQKLVGAQPVGALTAYPGVSGYEFSYADGHYLWLIWSADGTDQTLTLPGDFLRAYDKYGAALTPSGGQLVVGWSPIYMEMQGE